MNARHATKGTGHIIVMAPLAASADETGRPESPCCGWLLTKPIDRRELPRQIAGFLQRAAGEKKH